MTLKYTDPLEWIDDGLWQKAQTELGQYSVRADGKFWRWQSYFVEYYDEDEGMSASEADAKAYCQNDWDTRVQPILERFAKRCLVSV